MRWGAASSSAQGHSIQGDGRVSPGSRPRSRPCLPLPHQHEPTGTRSFPALPIATPPAPGHRPIPAGFISSPNPLNPPPTASIQAPSPAQHSSPACPRTLLPHPLARVLGHASHLPQPPMTGPVSGPPKHRLCFHGSNESNSFLPRGLCTGKSSTRTLDPWLLSSRGHFPLATPRH